MDPRESDAEQASHESAKEEEPDESLRRGEFEAECVRLGRLVYPGSAFPERHIFRQRERSLEEQSRGRDDDSPDEGEPGGARPHDAQRSPADVGSRSEETRRTIGALGSPSERGKAMPTLFERLGGLDAITAVVDSFVGRCASDTRINPKFARTDVPRLKKMLVDQVCEASGGPCIYTGRSMKETHDGMGVTAGEFDALVEDLVAALDEFNVPEAEKGELLGVLGPMRSEIVEEESAETGTALPDLYQVAPALS
jgi:hemoglobin